MAQVRCEDGRLLDVVPVPVLDRTGAPYEATLRLLLDGAPFGHVGERCAGSLAALAVRLEGEPLLGTRVRAGLDDRAWAAVRPLLPRDHELFSLRCRDPDDVPSSGELRAVAARRHTWDDDDGWRSTTEVRLQAWGDDGTGVRAVLSVPGLRAWLDRLLEECARPTT